jgi:hypothetical protein
MNCNQNHYVCHQNDVTHFAFHEPWIVTLLSDFRSFCLELEHPLRSKIFSDRKAVKWNNKLEKKIASNSEYMRNHGVC